MTQTPRYTKAERQAKIDEARQSQSEDELKRKFEKIKDSKHRKQYWTAEEIDLAKHEGNKMAKFFNNKE